MVISVPGTISSKKLLKARNTLEHRLLRPLSSNLILDVNSKVTWRLSWPQRPPGAVRSIMHMDIRAVRAAKGPFIKDFARGGLKSLKILQINTTDRLREM